MNIILLYHDIIDRGQGTQLPPQPFPLKSVLFIISPFQRALQNVHRSYTAPVLKGSFLVQNIPDFGALPPYHRVHQPQDRLLHRNAQSLLLCRAHHCAADEIRFRFPSVLNVRIDTGIAIRRFS